LEAADGGFVADLHDLTEQHLARLRASGISDDVIEQRGYRSLDAEAAATELPRLGFNAKQSSLGSGILIPLSHGYQFRPDSPRLRDGKPVKYETPQGQSNGLDIHPARQQLAGDPTAHLVFTEGPLKADALVTATSANVCVVALTGVWNWRGKNPSGGTTALALFNDLALNEGRPSWVVFDSDTRTNPMVLNACIGLSAYLRSRKANVKAVLPPPGPNGEKVGVDDWLVAGNSIDTLWTLTFDPETEKAYPRGVLASEMRKETPAEPEWFIKGIAAPGWVTKIAAREKTGKGKLGAYCIGKMERAEESVFGPAYPEPIYSLVLTEEPDESMVEKLNDHNVEHARIIRGWELAALTWEQKWNHLLDIAIEEGRRHIFVDNIARAAGVEDDADLELANAVSPFADACRAHRIALTVDHHHKKGGDSIENLSRGGTALPGAMDINIEMLRVGKGWTSRKRKLYSRGRQRSTVWELVIELTEDNTEYILATEDTTEANDFDHADVPDPDAMFPMSETPEGRRHILTWRALRDHGPFTKKQYAEHAEFTEQKAYKHLSDIEKLGLATKAEVEVEVKGKKGGTTRANLYTAVIKPQDESEEPGGEVVPFTPRPPKSQPKPALADAPCPKCGASGDEHCRTPSGQETKKPHKSRTGS
jgi:hypothetical protein